MEEDKKCDECNLKCLIYCLILNLLIPITWILLALAIIWIISLIIGISFLKVIGCLILIFMGLIVMAAMQYVK